LINTMTARPHSVLRRFLEIAVTVCVVAACSNATTKQVGPAWPEYRGDLARDGHAHGSALDAAGASKLGLAWRAHLDGAVDGTPAVAGGLVIAGSAGGTLEAIDERTGHAVWSVHGLGWIASSPTVDSSRVYVTTLAGDAYAFDLHGKRLWDWAGPPNSALWASPVVYRGEVIIGVASPYGDTPLVAGRLYGLDASTGKVRWTECLRAGCAAGDGVWSTASIDSGGTAFVGVGNPDDGVLAFDAMTGQRKWMTTLYADRDRDLDVGASPVLFELGSREVLAQATVEGMFALLDARTGNVIWSRELVAGSAVHGLFASAYDGTLYAVSASAPTGIFAIDPANGSTRWEQATDLPVYSAPAVGSCVVVFGTGNVFGDLSTGSLLALSTSDGRALWTYDMHSAVRSGPALAGDLVVVGDYAGDVMAFSPRR
jgi:polyvinyl alcohol dehydrogenase (cytochrome)